MCMRASSYEACAEEIINHYQLLLLVVVVIVVVVVVVVVLQKKMSCQEKNGELCEYCRPTDFVRPSSATPAPRPYPDYSKLPDFHYLPCTKTPTTGGKLNLMIINLELK